MIFFKNEKERYFDKVKKDYGEEERKVIRELLKSNLTLEQFKDCIMPIIDYSKQENIMEAKMNGINVPADYGTRKLKADEIREIASCYEEGLTKNQITSIINANFYTNVNAEFIKLSKEAFKKGMNEYEFHKMNDIGEVKEILNAYKKEYPTELINILKTQNPGNNAFVFNKEYREAIMDSYDKGATVEQIKKFAKIKRYDVNTPNNPYYEYGGHSVWLEPEYDLSKFKKEIKATSRIEQEKESTEKDISENKTEEKNIKENKKIATKSYKINSRINQELER